MDKFLALTFAGLCTAAIYAIAASGLVLTYTTTGVFNFAHGAIGMLGAFTYWQLHVAWGWPTPIAFLAVLLVIGPAVRCCPRSRDHAPVTRHVRGDTARRDGQRAGGGARAHGVAVEPAGVTSARRTCGRATRSRSAP